MNRPLKLALTMLGGLWCVAGSAQAQFMPAMDRGRVTAVLSPEELTPGSGFKLEVTLELAKGWHANAHRVGLPGLIPTTLELQLPAGLALERIDYPEGKQVHMEWAGRSIALYEGRVTISAVGRVRRDAAPGPVTIQGGLQYQACDDQVCLAPRILPVNVTTEILPAPAGMDTTEPDATAVAAATPGVGLESALAERGLVLFLAGVLLLGLGLNLTPCVYPMLSVTVSIFGAQTDTNTLRVFSKALVYVLGMATMYSTLGLVAALTGGLFGGLLQHQWVLAGIAALLLALALSMFGLFEIRAPTALMSRLGGTTTASYAGLFVSGLVVGVIAAPCVGPPIVALLALVAARADPWFGFGTLFTMSIGLGAPYLVLGTFSGLLKKLPRSGMWMDWTKKLFGVVLAGVALFYFALAFAPGLVFWVMPVTLLAGGAYLGFVERSGRDRRGFRALKWAVGLTAILTGSILLASRPSGAPDWIPYHPDRLAEARAEGKPVLLDFYADWCIPCHEMDLRTFSDPRVIETSRQFVTLKADMTRTGSPEVQKLVENFSIVGVPTYIFIGRDGRELTGLRRIGFVPADEFLALMNRALAHEDTASR
jgi:thiol:disulfide interchange protein DsbD